MSKDLTKKAITATKWNAITEVVSKLIAPITAMVLARLLTPEAFGVVATISIIISFAEVFADAGFQKYIIHYEFEDEEDLHKSTNVAFLSNLAMSIVLWGLIIIFRHQLATLVGNPGLGNVLAIACVSIPLVSFSSIQTALYKRDFDFKTLFIRKAASLIVPFVVTIPLALYFRNYWSLIIGTIVMNLLNAVILTVKSKWKPNFYYSFTQLKKMLSYCSWAILDAILIWCTSYIDIFIIGIFLNEYYLGLYKTTTNLVGQILALVTGTVMPVVMPMLARQQNEPVELRNSILKMMRIVSIILIPLGVGIFLFRDLIVSVFLGDQWTEAADFLGLWGLISVIVFIFSRFATTLYPAIGKPRTALTVQILHLVVLIPTVYFSAQRGFECLYIARSLIRIQLVLLNMYFLYQMIKLSPLRMIKEVYPYIISALMMVVVYYLLDSINNTQSVFFDFMSITVCAVIYFISVMLFFPSERMFVIKLKEMVLKKK